MLVRVELEPPVAIPTDEEISRLFAVVKDAVVEVVSSQGTVGFPGILRHDFLLLRIPQSKVGVPELASELLELAPHLRRNAAGSEPPPHFVNVVTARPRVATADEYVLDLC
jgi:hypothetical protein